MKVSIVISVYNEQESIFDFSNQLMEALLSIQHASEIIWVNDGSLDESKSIICQVIEQHKQYEHRVVDLTRNFGHEAAMIAGIDHASGDFIICMDADGQHPPAEIGKMIQEAQNGFEIVNMVRESKREKGSGINTLSGLFYPLFNKLSDYRFEENASDFFLISHRVAEALRTTFRERNRFLRGYIQIMGFDKTTCAYSAPKRTAGTSKYSKRKLFQLAIAAISSFSKKPLYFALAVSGIFASLSLVLAAYSVYMFFLGDHPPSGYTTLVVFMSVCFTMVYLILAIMSIYIGFSFDEVKDRPIYLVKESKSFKNNE